MPDSHDERLQVVGRSKKPQSLLTPGINAEEVGEDALLAVALSGLLERLVDEDGRILDQREVAEIVGFSSPPQLAHLLGQGQGVPLWLPQIQSRLHGWAAANYDTIGPRRAPDDHRRVLLPELHARVYERPRAARCQVPAGWFRELATAVLDRQTAPAPVVAIAAGQSLVHNIELLDRLDRKPVVLSTRTQRKELLEQLDGERRKTSLTVDALLNVAELPPALFGTEALMLLGRLRTRWVLARTEKRIRERGAGFRLWRVLSFTLKVERQLLEEVEPGPDPVRRFIEEQSSLGDVDDVLRDLLATPPKVVAYRGRSLHVEALRQRLLFSQAKRLKTGEIDDVSEPVAGDLERAAIENLQAIVRSPSGEEPRAPRERAYAAHVLNEFGEFIPWAGEHRGIIAYAKAKIDIERAFEERREPLKVSPGEVDRITDQLSKARTLIYGELDRKRHPRLPKRLTKGGIDSPLAAMVVAMVGSIDGVRRRRIADCIRSGMLRDAVAPALCAVVADGNLAAWIRENAVVGLSFLGAGSGDSTDDLTVLQNLVDIVELVDTDDEDRCVSFIHAAAWALGDCTLVRLGFRSSLRDDQLQTFARMRQVLYGASASKHVQVRRAAVHGLICMKPLNIPPEEGIYPICVEDVQARLNELAASDPDVTVRALIDQPIHVEMVRPPT